MSKLRLIRRRKNVTGHKIVKIKRIPIVKIYKYPFMENYSQMWNIIWTWKSSTQYAKGKHKMRRGDNWRGIASTTSYHPLISPNNYTSPYKKDVERSLVWDLSSIDHYFATLKLIIEFSYDGAQMILVK